MIQHMLRRIALTRMLMSVVSGQCLSCYKINQEINLISDSNCSVFSRYLTVYVCVIGCVWQKIEQCYCFKTTNGVNINNKFRQE